MATRSGSPPDRFPPQATHAAGSRAGSESSGASPDTLFAANQVTADDWGWSGGEGIFATGLAFAVWSFVGIEGTSSLASEARNPSRSLPRGMILGLGLILVTTVVMGLGSIGTLSQEGWMALIADGSSDAPHLAIGAAMFGEGGRLAMATAAVAATWSTLVIALAAVPRMIVALGRDGLFFGPASGFFAQVHRRTGVPVRATLLVVVLQVAVMLSHGAVVDVLYVAAYLFVRGEAC